MSFTDVAAQSKTFARAWADLVDGFGRRELWLHLGWQDIKQRYRRSVLGPFWITIGTATTAVAMGGLYSKLFHLDLAVHLPYVTLGLIVWNLLNAAILEGADVFVANILAGPLAELAPRFARLCKPGAPFALSGILDGQHDELLDVYAPWFDQLAVQRRDDWIRIDGIRKPRTT